MTKGIHVMHSEAERCAINKGPRLSNVNGTDKVSYYLTKSELRDLFRRNGFNTDGVPWLKMIIGWKETWGEIAPSPATILDKNEDWRVYFIHPNKTDYITLQMAAENNGVPLLAVDA